MSNWKAGDIAIYQPAPGHPWEGKAGPGSECELVRFDLDEGDRGWLCRFPGDPNPSYPDGLWWVAEPYLRKRPDDNLFTQWFESHIITDIRPTETQVREGLKGILQPFGAIKDSPQGVRARDGKDHG